MFARSLVSTRTSLRVASRLQQTQCSYQYLQRAPAPFRPQRSPQRHMSNFRVTSRLMWDRLRALNRDEPIVLPSLIVCIVVLSYAIGFIGHMYVNVYQPIDHGYPKPIAKKLKRAIHYTTIDPDPNKAIKYFQEAIELCKEHKIHIATEHVIGIQLRLAQVLEEHGQKSDAIRYYEARLWEWRYFLEEYPERAEWVERQGGEKRLRKHRTRVLQRVVQTCVKLGQLYSDPTVNNLEAAEKNFTEAVETALLEQRRREKEHVSEEEEGPWLSNEEIGGTLEELGHHYDQKEQYSLSAPLFLRALSLGPPPCHAAMLMNNLSTSLAQTTPGSGVGTPTSKPALIGNATAWAEKAIQVASSVEASQRTDECDQCCAVAAYNLGEFAEMEGLWEKARDQYKQASAKAKSIGYFEGRQRADEALKRLREEHGR